MALELRSDYAGAYYNRGNAYFIKGENDRAIADYSKAIELRPNHAGAYYNRGNAYFIKGERDGAIIDYTKVITLTPEDASAFYNRGIVWLHMEEWEKASSDLAAARDMGIDIIAEFHRTYESIEDFEQKNGVCLPKSITVLLIQQ